MLILINENQNIENIISGNNLDYCNPQEKLCKLQHTLWDRNSACVAALYKKSDVHTLHTYCHFECTKLSNTKDPSFLPKIYHLNYREYVISNPSPRTTIKLANNTEKPVNPNNLQIGAVYLEIPCDAKIIKKSSTDCDDTTLVDILIPCFKPNAPSKPWLIRTISAQWTKTSPSELEHGLHAVHNYDDNYDLISKEWKKITPTTTLKTIAEYENELKNITLQATTNTIFGSQFYADIIYVTIHNPIHPSPHTLFPPPKTNCNQPHKPPHNRLPSQNKPIIPKLITFLHKTKAHTN